MKKKLFLIFIPIILIVVVFIVFIIKMNTKVSLEVMRYDLTDTISLGKYSLEKKYDSYYVKDKNKTIEEFKSSDKLYKCINDYKYIMYDDGYYFTIEIIKSEIVVTNYTKDNIFSFETFTLDNIIPEVKINEQNEFYNYVSYDSLEDNVFDINSKETLINYFNTLNSNICQINGDEVLILAASDIILGFIVRFELEEEGFYIYEKNYYQTK